MASPDVFISSPLRVARREHMAISSSPDLPSLQDMMTQRQKTTVLKSGSKAAAIPDDVPTSFTKASSLWKSIQAQDAATPHLLPEAPLPEPIVDVDTSVSIIEAPVKPKLKPRKPRRRKAGTEKQEIDTRPASGSPIAEQPWKKYKTKTSDEGNGNGAEEFGTVEAAFTARTDPGKQTDTMSSHFQRKPDATKVAQAAPAETKVPKPTKVMNGDVEEVETEEAEKVSKGGPKTKKTKKTDIGEPKAVKPASKPNRAHARESQPAKRRKADVGELEAAKAKKVNDEGPTEKADAKEPTAAQSKMVDAVEPKPTKAKNADLGEPLRLEAAMTRRLDWTPPKQNTPISIHSASSAIDGASPSKDDDEEPRDFQKLMATYECKDSLQPGVSANPEDASFKKKRKLIECVATKAADETAPAAQEPSPMKQKAPRKKPRTITELATAAYRVESPVDLAPPPALPVGAQESERPLAANKGKAPAKPRKKTAKASKKKPQPVKPILLSPVTALRQVANQDFVFGTSSQLATEHSPSFLRDLQAAMRHSNQLKGNDFVTPINSDAIEPPEQRAKLWDAAARDADGDLFDVEVVDLADGLPQLPAIQDDSNPFGYVRGDEEQASGSKPREVVDSQTEDSFLNLSDILPPPGSEATDVSPQLPPIQSRSDVLEHTGDNLDASGKSRSREVANPQTDDSFINLSDILPPPGSNPILAHRESPFSGSQISASIGPRHCGSPPVPSERNDRDIVDLVEEEQNPMGRSPPCQDLDLYADNVVSKRLASSGTGYVKKRKVTTALLDPNYQANAGSGVGSVGAVASISTASIPTTAGTARSGAIKKPRGRPRKNSVTEPEAQEPPPSAQPPASPKRPRGRPRKDSISQSKVTVAKGNKKSGPAKKPTQIATTPKSKKPTSKMVLEIPDSESEISASPCSSPEPTFSPPAAMDVSLSMEEDTELSLLSPTDEEVPLFTHITKAVTTAPRTSDPANPSWHEKILLYDPIVLEDLAAWLNSGQLAGVGYDGAVTPAEVKKWCESKSVCCLWKVSLRGRERKRL